jgi:hypothetical protein
LPSPFASACVHLAWASPAASLELLDADTLVLLPWSASMLEEDVEFALFASVLDELVEFVVSPYVGEEEVDGVADVVGDVADVEGVLTLPVAPSVAVVLVEFVEVTSVCWVC